MKFETNSQVLKKVFEILSKIPYSHSNPIKSAFFLEVTPDELIVRVSDELITIEQKITNSEIKINEPGKIIVNAFILNELVQKFNSTIKFNTSDTKILILESKQSKTRINLLDVELWKDFSNKKNGIEVTFSSENLREIQKEITFATQSREGRVVFQGVNLRTVGQHLVATATDGSRVARKELFPTTHTLDVILSSRVIAEVNRLAAQTEKTETIKAFFEEDEVVFMIGEKTIFKSFLIHENFPDTEPQLKQNFVTSITCATTKILEAVERTSVVFERRSLPRTILQIKENALYVSSPEESEVGHFRQQVETLQIEGENQTVSLQSKFLLDALKSIAGEKIVIKFSANKGPLKIHALNNKKLVHLIMPFWTF